MLVRLQDSPLLKRDNKLNCYPFRCIARSWQGSLLVTSSAAGRPLPHAGMTALAVLVGPGLAKTRDRAPFRGCMACGAANEGRGMGPVVKTDPPFHPDHLGSGSSAGRASNDAYKSNDYPFHLSHPFPGRRPVLPRHPFPIKTSAPRQPP